MTRTDQHIARRSKRSLALLGGIAALLLTLTTACTPGATDVHIDELGNEAEAIGESLMATIDGVDRFQPDGHNSGWSWDNSEAGERDPSAERNWGWEAMVVLAEDSNVLSEEAAARMAGVMTSSDKTWTVTEPSDSRYGGKWEFRRPAEDGNGNWYVGINFTPDAPPAPQIVRVVIESPYTANRSESQKTKDRAAARSARTKFASIAAQVETALREGEHQLNEQRIHYFLGSIPDGKTRYLSALHRWQTAAQEVRDFIGAARQSLDIKESTR